MPGTWDMLAFSVGLQVTVESLILGYYRYQNYNPSITGTFREINEQRRQHPTATSLPEELLREIESFLRAKADRYAHNKLKRFKKPWTEGDTRIAYEINVTISKFLNETFSVASAPGTHPFEQEKSLSHINLYLPSKLRPFTVHPSWRKIPRDEAEEQALLRRVEGNKMLWAGNMINSLKRDPDLKITLEETLTINKATKELELEIFFTPNPVPKTRSDDAFDDDLEDEDSDSDSTEWEQEEWPSIETEEDGVRDVIPMVT